MIFKFRGFGICRQRLQVMNHEKRCIADFGCTLGVGHGGMHLGPAGQTWFNQEGFELDMERRFIVPKPKTIILPP